MPPRIIDAHLNLDYWLSEPAIAACPEPLREALAHLMADSFETAMRGAHLFLSLSDTRPDVVFAPGGDDSPMLASKDLDGMLAEVDEMTADADALDRLADVLEHHASRIRRAARATT